MIVINYELHLDGWALRSESCIKSFVLSLVRGSLTGVRFIGCPNHAEYQLLDPAVRKQITKAAREWNEFVNTYRVDRAISEALRFIRENRNELTEQIVEVA